MNRAPAMGRGRELRLLGSHRRGEPGQVTALDPMTGVAEAVAPGLLRVLAPNPSPYTFTGTMSYVLGERSVAVIDPGPAEPSHLAALEGAIDGRPVEAILVTHNHRDHSPGARPLAERTGAPIVGAAPLSPPALDGGTDAAFDADHAPDRVLADGDRVDGDGWSLEAVATPGHTSNHLCLAWGGGDALFSGDHVMGWSTSVVIPPDGDMGDYMARPDEAYRAARRRPTGQATAPPSPIPSASSAA